MIFLSSIFIIDKTLRVNRKTFKLYNYKPIQLQNCRKMMNLACESVFFLSLTKSLTKKPMNFTRYPSPSLSSFQTRKKARYCLAFRLTAQAADSLNALTQPNPGYRRGRTPGIIQLQLHNTLCSRCSSLDLSRSRVWVVIKK